MGYTGVRNLGRMQHRSSVYRICLIWLAWVIILLSYQSAVAARYTVLKPDRVLPWTARDTGGDLSNRPYLADPFLQTQVAWDSEFYLSIATQGYDDPLIRTLPPQPGVLPPFNRPLSLNYAFFPVYPFLMRLVAVPLGGLGLSAIAAAKLAGVLISVLGTLAAMLALNDLASSELPEAGGLRAAFYLIAFPTGFFLSQVYTEGLFVGLTFSCFACLKRGHWLRAGVLATVATLTRAVGVFLVVPLALVWLKEGMQNNTLFSRAAIAKGALVLTPILTLLIWKQSFWGGAFDLVEKYYFQCEPLALSRARIAWRDGFMALFGSNSQTVVYFAIEIVAVLLGVTACLATLKRDPGMAVYGFLVIAISMTCGVAQGMHRYILAVPSIFLILSQWGSNEVFDRVWSLASILLMGMLAALFTFDMWVG